MLLVVTDHILLRIPDIDGGFEDFHPLFGELRTS
jgi:hypothetical protein